VQTPQTRYARCGDASIAYQVVGDGPVDLVIAPGWLSNLDLLWVDPGWVRFITGLASFARVILYDARGCGLSDPIDRAQPLESRADDLLAVLDAAGSAQTAIFGLSMGGPLAVMLAASRPERVKALVLYGTYATGSVEPNGTPERERWISLMQEVISSVDHWGEGRSVDWGAPTLRGNALYRRAVGAFERASFPPRLARLSLEANMTELDVRAILPAVRVPTLVLHRRDERIPLEYARELAREIDGARLVELDGQDHLPTVGDVQSIIGEVEEFLTGVRHRAEPDRMLATIVFTDIVDSTRLATDLGDTNWRHLLDSHDSVVRDETRRHGGREVKQTGDGFLLLFDGPARGVRCAMALVERLAAADMPIRCGVHTGECELRKDDIGGIAVHIGARVLGSAGPNEVVVSSTVKDLVSGSGITFADRGTYSLKGIADEWRLFAAVGDSRSPA
jgi:pimeloyl-ACP methyl ester carboxylesterase